MTKTGNIKLTYVLDYPYGDRDLEMQLSAQLFRRCEEFRAAKEQAYAEAVTDEEMSPIIINYAYAPTSLTEEVAKQIIREKRGQIKYEENYSFYDAKDTFAASIGALSGYGTFLPRVLIHRNRFHRFYYLEIACDEAYPHVLTEIDSFFKEPFHRIDSVVLISEVLADPSPALVRVNMVYQYAHDWLQPYDNIITLFKKLLRSTDTLMLEDALNELCCDVFYQQGSYARALKAELSEILEGRSAVPLPDEHLAQLREALEELNTLP